MQDASQTGIWHTKKRFVLPNPNTNLGYGLISDKNEIKSEVENTLTLDCFLNDFSSDQIGALSEELMFKLADELLKESKLTDELALKLGDELKERVAKRHGL